MKKYLIIAIAVLSSALFFTSKRIVKLKKENERQSGNVEALMSETKRYKVRDSLNVAQNTALNLTVDELKKYRADDAALIKELKLRPKDVEYITKTVTQTRDSLVYIIDSTGCFNYKDKWLQVDACIGDSSMIIQSRDSIAQVLHLIYKRKFLWWRWRVKGVRQEIVSFNPNSFVEFSEVIKIK